jgi:3-hydroxybutyryl-CoA dehydrogenase
MAIRKVGVVGCGLMGSGIAQVSAAAGFPTVVREVAQPVLDKGWPSSRSSPGRGGQGQAVRRRHGEDARNLKGTTEIKDLADCDLVVEAVSEDLNLKRELFAQLDGVCRPDAIFASNTSSLSITELSTFSKHPERVIGLHFFNPVPLMKLVEVVTPLRRPRRW